MDVEYLIEEAKALKGCEEGIEILNSCKSITDIIDGYYDYIDFCLAKNFPSKSFILKHRNDFRNRGIYIDESITLYNPERIVLLGSCNVSVKMNNGGICRAYVSGESILGVDTCAHAIIMVDALENSIVKANVNKPSRVIVNLYGNAQSEGASRTILKNKKTYEL